MLFTSSLSSPQVRKLEDSYFLQPSPKRQRTNSPQPQLLQLQQLHTNAFSLLMHQQNHEMQSFSDTSTMQMNNNDQTTPFRSTTPTNTNTNTNTNSNTNTMHSQIHGTMTPITQTNSRDQVENDKMEIENHLCTRAGQIVDSQESLNLGYECPCGHLHGAGQGFDHHDVSAVGFVDFPMLRGPD